MRNSDLKILAVDHKSDAVIVEFSNGQTGSFSPDFLLDHINADGNWDVTNISSEKNHT
jgi:hypothetical protein